MARARNRNNNVIRVEILMEKPLLASLDESLRKVFGKHTERGPAVRDIFKWFIEKVESGEYENLAEELNEIK